LLGEGNLRSDVGESGFMIGEGALKEGDINPLTSDKIIKGKDGDLGSYSTAKEIEVWEITFLE
jgi:hypothetical protein